MIFSEGATVAAAGVVAVELFLARAAAPAGVAEEPRMAAFALTRRVVCLRPLLGLLGFLDLIIYCGGGFVVGKN
jgi:hypothetical protein